MIHAKAASAEIEAALRPGVLVSAVLVSGRGRMVSGRFERMVNGRVKIDSEAETLAIGDICAIKLTTEEGDDGRKTATPAR